MIRQSIYTIVAGFVKTYLRHSFGVSTFSLSSMIILRLVEKNHKAHQTYDYLSNAREGFIVFKPYCVRDEKFASRLFRQCIITVGSIEPHFAAIIA